MGSAAKENEEMTGKYESNAKPIPAQQLGDMLDILSKTWVGGILPPA